MAAIFHNGQSKISVSVNICESGDPNLGVGVVIWNFLYDEFPWNGSHWPFLSRMANTNFPFPLTLEKAETQRFWEVVNWKLSVWQLFIKWRPFFHFFYNGWHKFSIFIKTWFSVQHSCMITFLYLNIYAWHQTFKGDDLSALKHLCMGAFITLGSVFNNEAWWPLCT